MVNKKIITSAVVIATLIAGSATYAATDTSITGSGVNKTMHSQGFWPMMKNWWMGNRWNNMMNNTGIWFWKNGWLNQLTDAEKTSLSTMTNQQKQDFFAKKKIDAVAKATLRENVIDKLLAGTVLTTEEEAIRQEIITERAAVKAKKDEMVAIQAIMEKNKSGQVLTVDEQTKLNAFIAKMPNGWKEWKRKWNMKR